MFAPLVAAVTVLAAPAAAAATQPAGEAGLDRSDQAMIVRVRSDPAPEREDDDVHRVPREVFDRLDRAGPAGLAGGAGEGPGAETERPEGPDHGVWWAVPGLVVGFAAGIGGTRLIRRAAAGPGAGPPRDEPRQELIDL
ncbi:hypothetical protein [Streptomyces sp. NRRL B-24085]|uniref:hypothetical protein n=1 Tax=Streptomyces sp. NRRL B-24085 TaxID=1709476 RepID=UPI000A832A0C|nr:hypothetical protein [Streptomyces sp. NRRL B-24085]